MAANGLNDDDAEGYAAGLEGCPNCEKLKQQLAAAQGNLTAFTAGRVQLSEELEQRLKDFAKEQLAKMGENCLVVGRAYRHPNTGRLLRVTAGSFLGSYGRVSNWWQWNYLADDFSPLPETDQGYGWSAKPIEEPSS
jgi:hypothetical protein